MAAGVSFLMPTRPIASIVAGLVLAANALDAVAPRSNSKSNKQDILKFKRHLRQSWAPPKLSDRDADSDSSESYYGLP